MNTSTQPSEGAGRSRSRAAGELTLGLMSGEERGVRRSAFALLWERACSRRRPDSRPISCRHTRINCGSEPARDSGLTADQVPPGRTNPANRPAGRPPRTLLRCTPPHEAEWRFCAVGNPAWMPGSPPPAMDGRWRRAHGAGPERGNAEPGRGTECQGQEPLVTWGFSK